MSEERNDGLHPRHPGRGKPTALIGLEADAVECGGFLVFLPSGLTKTVAWRSTAAITPTASAAKDYTARVIESLLAAGNTDDVQRTNWTSVAAAVQRIISDFNDRLTKAINDKMARDLATPAEKRWLQ
ncbi:MAG: hypothetical protein KF863_21470 [Rubrivivax sp.]|nr:hypothetical protein [Rubrivivax sp.]